MSDQTIPDEPPEQTEVYEQYDEVAETGSTGGAEDPGATGVSGAEADLTRLTEMPVDQVENEEIGANLDDPDRMAMLDGGMDDPDGIDPDQVARTPEPEDVGWDLDAGDRP
ncbi:hypothetical protein K6U06_22560 [Acidiferrimicrobium sp. IK]|uniref:hypothetical protein n=1 Tax=Acidiferrimicrobium sp. IK TaxID=2871700 RepID=UPI0021CB253C|nr:hypothetical protein [Acidiferrimicrobium sp. IK]MCU4187162.1 hypothetical protein [Acidiferrimicrobium sp. IK]